MHSNTCKMSVNNTAKTSTGIKVTDRSPPVCNVNMSPIPWSDLYFMSILQENLFYQYCKSRLFAAHFFIVALCTCAINPLFPISALVASPHSASP